MTSFALKNKKIKKEWKSLLSRKFCGVRGKEEETVTIDNVLYARPKESQHKFTKLGILPDPQRYEVCAVKTLERFLQRTSNRRLNLPVDNSLFLTYLQDDTNISVSSSAQPKTVANWVKKHMVNAGIGKAYNAHSIRSAISTKAVMLGNSISIVKEHANWSQASNTFEQYYYKPTMKQHASTRIQNSIFAAENSTTWDFEAKATRIVLGTTYNTNIAGAKDEEVVQSRPWYQKLF